MLLRFWNPNRRREREQQLVVFEVAHLLDGEGFRIIRLAIDDILIAFARVEDLIATVDRDFFTLASHAVHAASIPEVA